MEGSATGVTQEDLLAQILEQQKAQRDEVAQLRAQIDKQKTPVPVVTQNAPSPEEALAVRLEEVRQHDFYCPACGNLVDYQQKCTGKYGTYGHAPTEVAPTTELTEGDPSGYTPAPYVTGEGALVTP